MITSPTLLEENYTSFVSRAMFTKGFEVLRFPIFQVAVSSKLSMTFHQIREISISRLSSSGKAFQRSCAKHEVLYAPQADNLKLQNMPGASPKRAIVKHRAFVPELHSYRPMA